MTTILTSTVHPFPEYPFGHPFDDHLYKEGLDLAELRNGRHYIRSVIPEWMYTPITCQNSGEYTPEGGAIRYQGVVVPGVPGLESVTIDGEYWNINWIADPSPNPDPDCIPEAVENIMDLRDQSARTAFYYIHGVKDVVIKDLHIIHTGEAVIGHTIFIENCHSVSIENSSFKGPVADHHIAIKNCDNIYIDNVEIAGTDQNPDPNIKEFALGGAISIGGGDQNKEVGTGISSTIIKNSYIHDFTHLSQAMVDRIGDKTQAHAQQNGYNLIDKPPLFNYDAVGIRSPGTGIFFNNYIENYGLEQQTYEYYDENQELIPVAGSVTGLDIGHSRGDEIARGENPLLEGYYDKIFKVERNIFDEVEHNKITGRFGTVYYKDLDGDGVDEEYPNQLLFSNNIYFNSFWNTYFCNTEVVFAFESYYFDHKLNNNPDQSLLEYRGCVRNPHYYDDDPGNDNTPDTALNDDARLKPITRYNTHYYFEENGLPGDARIRPNNFIVLPNKVEPQGTLNRVDYSFFYRDVDPTSLPVNPIDPGEFVDSFPEDLIRGDHNIYTFNVGLNYYTNEDCFIDENGNGVLDEWEEDNWDCHIRPRKWIAPTYMANSQYLMSFNIEKFVDPFTQGASSNYAIESYQQLQQGEYSELIGSKDPVCAQPMLDARDINPAWTYLFGVLCSDLKTAGSQQPLVLDGFDYLNGAIILDDYGLFRRDFYGNSRMGPDVSVGAFQ